MRRSLFLVSAFLLVSATALAHGVHRQGNRSISFDDQGATADCGAMRVKFDGDRVPVVTENVPVGNLRSLRVRSDRNGGVRVIGSGGSGYSVRACKAVALSTDASQVRVSVNGDEVSASGPENDDWVVYFIVETPRNATLDISSTNGPIGVSHFNGTLTARAKNGPLSVKDSSGTITASTVNGPISIDGGSGNVKLTATNGPLSVKLDGSFWDGDLAASTQNGPLSLKLPRGYRSGVVVESLGHGPVSCRAERCAEIRRRDDDDDRLRRIKLGSGPATVLPASRRRRLSISGSSQPRSLPGRITATSSDTLQSPAVSQPRKLLTVLGVTFGIAVTVGNTIGAGILKAPGSIASYLPEFWPYMTLWIAGALYALLGANALSELGTMVPRSGGQYVFVRQALGDYAGFVVGWSDWISTSGTTAAVAMLFGEYTVGLFPELRTEVVVALMMLAIVTILQWFGIRAAGGAQTATSILKAVALLILVAACFILGSQDPLRSSMAVEREMPLMLAVILSLQAVIYTYDGWNAPIYFSEEIRDPGRNLPRAIFGGLLTVTVIYLLINVAFARVVPLPTLAGKNLAAASVAEHLFGMHGDTVLRAIMAVALVSAVNSNVLMAPRVLFAMASDGLFWRGATEVNRGGTPDVALLISSVLAAGFIVTGTFNEVIAKLAFFFVANYTLSFVSLFVLRRRDPDAARPYRAWGHPLTTGLGLVASVAFLVGAVMVDLKNSLYALALLAITVPTFVLMRAARRSKPVIEE